MDNNDTYNYHIASVSWGKDSLAMLWKLIWEEWPLDEIVFYDTGMEFDAIYKERDRTLYLLKANNIKYTELKPKMCSQEERQGIL